MILYEHPFNERIRTYLRMERLHARHQVLRERDCAVDHHHALTSLFEMLDVAARADLKSDVLKDLSAQKAQLNAFKGNPAIAERVLDAVLAQLDSAFKALNAQSGKAGAALADDEWLMALRSRASIPGGTCEFDLPAYHAWQHRDGESRRAALRQWGVALRPINEGVALLLKLLRESGNPVRVMALNGSYQQTLAQGKPCQLLRLRLDESSGCVPEISGNRLMVSVRLMRMSERLVLEPSTAELPLELALCA